MNDVISGLTNLWFASQYYYVPALHGNQSYSNILSVNSLLIRNQGQTKLQRWINLICPIAYLLLAAVG